MDSKLAKLAERYVFWEEKQDTDKKSGSPASSCSACSGCGNSGCKGCSSW